MKSSKKTKKPQVPKGNTMITEFFTKASNSTQPEPILVAQSSNEMDVEIDLTEDDSRLSPPPVTERQKRSHQPPAVSPGNKIPITASMPATKKRKTYISPSYKSKTTGQPKSPKKEASGSKQERNPQLHNQYAVLEELDDFNDTAPTTRTTAAADDKRQEYEKDYPALSSSSSSSNKSKTISQAPKSSKKAVAASVNPLVHNVYDCLTELDDVSSTAAEVTTTTVTTTTATPSSSTDFEEPWSWFKMGLPTLGLSDYKRFISNLVEKMCLNLDLDAIWTHIWSILCKSCPREATKISAFLTSTQGVLRPSTLDGCLEFLESHIDSFTLGKVVIKFLTGFSRRKLDAVQQELFDMLYPKIKDNFRLYCKPQSRKSWIDFNDDAVSSLLFSDIVRVATISNAIDCSRIDALFVNKVGKRLLFDLYDGSRPNFVTETTRQWNHLFPKVTPISDYQEQVVFSGKGFDQNRPFINLETWREEVRTAQQSKMNLQQSTRHLEKLQSWAIVSTSLPSSSTLPSKDRSNFETVIRNGLKAKAPPKEVANTSAHFGNSSVPLITRKISLKPLPLAKQALKMELRKQNRIYNFCVREFNLAINGSSDNLVGILCGKYWRFLPATNHLRDTLKRHLATGAEDEEFLKIRENCFKNGLYLKKAMRSTVGKLTSSIGEVLNKRGNLLYTNWTKDPTRDAPLLDFVKAVDITTAQRGSRFKMTEKSLGEKCTFKVEHAMLRQRHPLFGENLTFYLNGHDLDPQSADIFPDMNYIIKDEHIVPPLCKHVRDVYYRMARQEVKSKQISSPFLVALLSHIQPDEPLQPSECSNFKLLLVVFQKVTTSFITERLTNIPDTGILKEATGRQKWLLRVLLDLSIIYKKPNTSTRGHCTDPQFHLSWLRLLLRPDSGDSETFLLQSLSQKKEMKFNIDKLGNWTMMILMKVEVNHKKPAPVKTKGKTALPNIISCDPGVRTAFTFYDWKTGVTYSAGDGASKQLEGMLLACDYLQSQESKAKMATSKKMKDVPLGQRLSPIKPRRPRKKSQDNQGKQQQQQNNTTDLPTQLPLPPSSPHLVQDLVSSQLTLPTQDKALHILDKIMTLQGLADLLKKDSLQLSDLKMLKQLSDLEQLEILSTLKNSSQRVFTKFLSKLCDDDMTFFHMARLATNLDELLSKCQKFCQFSRISELSELSHLSELKIVGSDRSGLEALKNLNQLHHLSKLSDLQKLDSIIPSLQSLLKFVIDRFLDKSFSELQIPSKSLPSLQALVTQISSLLNTGKLNKNQKNSLNSIKWLCSDLIKLESLNYLDQVKAMTKIGASDFMKDLDQTGLELLELSSLFRFAGLSRLSRLSELSEDDTEVHKKKVKRAKRKERKRIEKREKGKKGKQDHQGKMVTLSTTSARKEKGNIGKSSTTATSTIATSSSSPTATTSSSPTATMSSSTSSNLPVSSNESPDPQTEDPPSVTKYLRDLFWRTKQRSKTLRRARLRKLRDCRHKVDNFHCHVQSFLVKNYDHVYLPPLRVSELVKHHQPSENVSYLKKTRFLAKKTVREMLNLRHYAFRRRLEQTSAQNPNFHVHTDCSEEWTSKVCGSCLEINRELGASKIFKCPNKDCKDHGVEVDRDANAASNLARKLVTEWTSK